MKIEITADGSHSLRHSLLGELYHSDRGAVGESMHVFINAGFCHVAQHKSRISLFEIGFGTGLNAWLTMQKAAEMGVDVDYYCVELYPIELDTAAALNFTNDTSFLDLHRAVWDTSIQISDSFRLTKHLCDFTQYDFKQRFDVVYYDAFAPEVQPELWDEILFLRLYSVMNASGVITTYTAKGVVKQAMRSAGFMVQRLAGALGKRHMLRAIK